MVKDTKDIRLGRVIHNNLDDGLVVWFMVTGDTRRIGPYSAKHNCVVDRPVALKYNSSGVCTDVEVLYTRFEFMNNVLTHGHVIPKGTVLGEWIERYRVSPELMLGFTGMAIYYKVYRKGSRDKWLI